MSGVLKHGNKEKDGVKAMGFPLCYNKVNQTFLTKQSLTIPTLFQLVSLFLSDGCLPSYQLAWGVTTSFPRRRGCPLINIKHLNLMPRNPSVILFL
ncbi:hypothetical protein DEO72_LG6g1616 [Vigna unguiculata]|uniref:Uncharacterized protein n=1 Tax=Vigna unguiculata TaxID=3917 RepID=A0A4D6M9X1_VIGUN|nr:hypothetical protein DEO72_LG6g1616 [Vigna unguiculata]